MKRVSIWFHIGFWVIYTIVFTIIEASYKGEYREAFLFELINLPLRLIVVYFNYFVLLPKFLLQNKTVKYFAYTLLTVIIAGFFQRIINYEVLNVLQPDMIDHGIWLPYKFLHSSTVIASPLIFLIGISVVWKVAELQKKTQSLRNEKLQSELKYLRSQINPHFLFNTLNNLYGLSLEKSEKTPELILKLSDFLSFSLYQANQKYIPLEKEIALIRDFIALEKSRFGDRIQVDLEIEERIDKIAISPLILVPFVENAFKHSLKDETETARIHIKLWIEADHLCYRVYNSKPSGAISQEQQNGLGLDNIKKRLDILYGKNHTLEIQNSTDHYEILLKIKLL